MSKIVFIVNPHAGNERGKRVWESVQPMLHAAGLDYDVYTTQHPDDVQMAIWAAYQQRAERIISIGGDGTNYVVLNALMAQHQAHPDHEFIYGTIPAGTGRDWARGVGLPLKASTAIEHVLHHAQPRLVDVGRVRFAGQQRYFLNISSVGLSNQVVQTVESRPKRPWTFLFAVIDSLLRYRAIGMRVELDGNIWYEGKIYITTVANGRSFGQGMLIAPHAEVDDGLFDIVIVEEMSLPKIAQALPTLFNGTHLSNPKVHSARAKNVRVIAVDGRTIGMDLDGDAEDGAVEFTYDLHPAALRVLL